MPCEVPPVPRVPPEELCRGRPLAGLTAWPACESKKGARKLRALDGGPGDGLTNIVRHLRRFFVRGEGVKGSEGRIFGGAGGTLAVPNTVIQVNWPSL
jgi:hypothetical protein